MPSQAVLLLPANWQARTTKAKPYLVSKLLEVWVMHGLYQGLQHIVMTLMVVDTSLTQCDM